MTQYPNDDMHDEVGLTVDFSRKVGETLAPKLGIENPEEFNEYGVRERPNGSLDVVFRAMEPGIRNGFEVTEPFLKYVADHSSGKYPFQQSHSMNQRANVGTIDGDSTVFDRGALWTVGHIPDTGSSVRSDVIADFTHTPPAIQDGSISYQRDSVEIDWPEDFDPWDPDEDRHPTFIEAEVKEFSLTPFPGGYDKDSGGLSPAFERLAENQAPVPKGQSSGAGYTITDRQYTITER